MKRVYSRIFNLLTPAQRKSTVVLLGLMVVGMLLEMLGIGMVIPVIALITQQDLAINYPALGDVIENLGFPTKEALITAAMLALVAMYLIKNLFLAYLAWRQTRFAYELRVELSQRLFTLYLRQPYTFHLQRNSAQLIRNVHSEVGMFATNSVMPSLQIITEGLVLFGVCMLMLAVEPLGTFVVVAVLSFTVWGFHSVTKKYITRWGEVRQYHDGMRIQHLHQGLGGAKDVKLLGRESNFLEQYGTHNIQSARVGQFQATLQQIPRLWLELLGIVGLAALVLTMLAQGKEISTIIPTLGLFAAAAFRLMPSFNRVLAAVQTLRYSLPVIDVLNEELKLAVPVLDNGNVNGSSVLQNEIFLSDVGFTYPGVTSKALAQLRLTIRKGESVGFIGASGSGKSTLVDVILGLLAPTHGQVLVDGKDIQQKMRVWQDQIGYVPQSIYLTDDTLKRNVAFGLPDDQINDEAMQRAIQAAQLEEFVEELNNGLDTVVGERGIRLSGGQRQRIGIARALYHDPGVLVLDEATSALDTATEEGVMQAVTALQGRKTIIIVAHRLSTVQNCDQLYRLEYGQIAESGKPDKILAKKANG